MSGVLDENKPMRLSIWVKRSLWAWLVSVTFIVLLVLCARFYITTSSGARFIEAQINKRSFGPIERVEVAGLEGDPLDQFTISKVSLYDKDGLWFQASSIDVEWSPWSLRNKLIHIQNVSSEEVRLLRKPVLNETQSSEKQPYSAQVETGIVQAFKIDAPVIGQEAIFQVSTVIEQNKLGESAVRLEAVRTDEGGDTLNLNFTRDILGEIQGEFDVRGVAGGTIAKITKSPDNEDVAARGMVKGNSSKGDGEVVLQFGDDPKVTVKGSWTENSASLTSKINIKNWPVFDTLSASLGSDVNLSANLDRAVKKGAFEVGVEAAQFSASSTGRLNAEGRWPEYADVTIRSSNLGGIISLPDGYKLGSGVVSGRLQNISNYEFDGSITLAELLTPYGQASSLSGPFKISQVSDSLYNIQNDLQLGNVTTDISLPFELSSEVSIQSKAIWDSTLSQITLNSLSLTSAKNNLSAAGKFNYADSHFDIKGNSEVTFLALRNIPSGQLQAEYNIVKTAESLPALTATGGFRTNVSFQPPLDQLVTDGINFNIDMSPIDGGFNIDNILISGENIRAALSGKVTDEVDIVGEFLLSAPFTHSVLDLAGGTRSSFAVMGKRDDPTIRLDADAKEASINGQGFKQIRLRTEIVDALKSPKGPIRLTANTDKGELDISARFASQNQAYIADNISLKWGQLIALGKLSKPINAPVSGELSLVLPQSGEQYAKATLTLVDMNNEQALVLNAEANKIAYNNIAIDSLLMEAEGTLSSITGQIKLQGQRRQDILERSFSFSSPLSIKMQDEGAYHITFEPKAKDGSIVIAAASPVEVHLNAGDIQLNAPLTLSGSPLNVNYSRISGQENFILKAKALPLTLLPMPDILADTRGEMSADFTLNSSDVGGGIVGEGSITLEDWRGYDIKSGKGLSGELLFDVTEQNVQWQLKAQSADGFAANSNGQLPIIQGDGLPNIRPNMINPLSGTFVASGEAVSILSLFTPSDAKPSGKLNANLALSGNLGNPFIEGDAAGQNLRMELPDLGTQLRDGRFMASFSNDKINISNLSVMDNDDGRLTGQGAFELGEYGRPIGKVNITLNDFRALDRQDYEGRLSGEIAYESKVERASLTGAILLKEIEVKQFVSGNATVVEIPVVEINKPKTLNTVDAKAPATPVDLDLKFNAPRKIFVRSRGLDVELSLDATVKGTLDAPEVFGQAKVLRGGYKIAGKELDFESGEVKFNGAIEDATVNLIANTTTQNISAQVQITGTVADPAIELSSEPDRPEDEILSTLLFGRSATELSAVEAAQLAGALAQFSGSSAGFDLVGGLRDALGVGQLSVGIGEDGSAQLVGGRYLTKNVYLQILSGGSTEQTGAIIDWEVRKNLSLISKLQADNDQSFSLKWKKDF